eukprot:Phypoly_transcript_02430.p1 GENE.Phypoly_transcript_02430~~Phypoly_transcript_02430.p1  ORF type:complete len:886 (+),score=114.46 Phypoly_transcript_02430:72-2729(+)
MRGTLLFLVSVLFYALCANAAALIVTTDVAKGSTCNSTVNCNVEDAFTTAVSGDSISFTAGTYKINNTLVPPSNISIQGVPDTVISCNSATTGFLFDTINNVTITWITIRDCQSAINIQSSTAISLTSTTITYNGVGAPTNGTGGGGVRVTSSTVNFDNCTISQNNLATIYASTSTVTITSSHFTSNSALSGGALYIDSSTVTVSNCDFTTNHATSNGGAIAIDDVSTASNVNITNCNFSNNSASSGAGIYAISGNVGLYYGSLNGNKANQSGGAVYVGPCQLFLASDVIVTGGVALAGAGIYVSNTCKSAITKNVTVDSTNIASNGNSYYVEGSANVSISNGAANGIFLTTLAPGPQLHSVNLTDTSGVSYCCAGSSVLHPSNLICDYPVCEAGKCANTTSGCQCTAAEPPSCPTCVDGFHGDYCELQNPLAFNVAISGNESSYIIVSINVTDPTGQFTLCSGLNPSIVTFPSAGSLTTSSLSPISASSPGITSCDGTFFYHAPAHGTYTGPLNFTYVVEAGGFSSAPAFVSISLSPCTTGLCGCGDSVCDSDGSSENCNTCPQDCPSPCTTSPVVQNATVHVNESSYVKINLNITNTQGSTPCNGMNITVTEFPVYGQLLSTNLAPINSSFPNVCDTFVYYEAPAHDSYPSGSSVEFSYRVTKESFATVATVSLQLSACTNSSECGCGDGVCNMAGEDCVSCAIDCPRPCGVCGDGECSASENCTTCASDCCGITPTAPPTANLTCGDGICDNSTENCTTCFEDCYSLLNCTSVCGDGLCDIFENCTSCPEDCNATCIIPTPPPSSTHKVDPHRAKIAVIVIGAVFGVFVVAILIVALLRRRKPRQLTRARRQNTGTELRRMTSDSVLINNSQNSLLRTESTV